MHITDVDALSCSELMLKIDPARVNAPFSLLESTTFRKETNSRNSHLQPIGFSIAFIAY